MMLKNITNIMMTSDSLQYIDDSAPDHRESHNDVLDWEVVQGHLDQQLVPDIFYTECFRNLFHSDL